MRYMVSYESLMHVFSFCFHKMETLTARNLRRLRFDMAKLQQMRGFLIISALCFFTLQKANSSELEWVSECPNACFNKNPCVAPFDKCVCKFDQLVYTTNNTANPNYRYCHEIQNFGDVQQNGYDILQMAMVGDGFNMSNLQNYPKYVQIGDEYLRILVHEGFLRDAANKRDVQVQKIDFHYCNLTDLAAYELGRVLKLNDVIEHLDLASNMIGPVGAQSLADGLKNNKGLKVLDLSENEIRAEGALALAQMLADNKVLKELHLFKDTIGTASARGLADAFRKRTFSRNAEIIFEVKGHNYQVGRNNIGDDGMKDLALYLKNNTSLEYLDVGECLIGPSGTKAIAETLMLKVNVGNTSVNGTIPNATIKSGIRHLKLGWNKIRNQGVKYLASMLKVNNVIETLDLGHNYVLSPVTHNVGDEGIIALADALAKNNSALKTLILWSNTITDVGAIALANALKSNVTRIEHLDLSNNYILDAGAKALGEALISYPYMKKLDLRGNNIGEVKNPLFENTKIFMDGKQNAAE